ncbi:TetR family transcriptional regulator [uncultured Pseudoteredinibacter sp.]|uniref:TetR/AcrR family transcriptional regulator n=1 Tax=uncultured Pseudoteredinibacter sp. TaxID=1641701 RepID=UPI00262DC810|nr:TetR family transcriptional regulator [uncultured Pseudoteredinibacter sp.]
MADVDKNQESNFKGRQPLRANSRHRRNEILQATLRLIANDGIRAVRHRAIAKEADVPLSATTYYFKDINDLINDAFALFVEQSQARNSWLQEQTLATYQSSQATLSSDPSGQQMRAELAGSIPKLVLEHVRRQVEDTQARRLEHAFLNETLHNNDLEARYENLRNDVIAAIEAFLQLIGNDSPAADAHSLHGIIQWLEYLLVVENCEANWQLAELTIERQIQRLFNNI